MHGKSQDFFLPLTEDEYVTMEGELTKDEVATMEGELTEDEVATMEGELTECECKFIWSIRTFIYK